ncbi:MAG: hypothetical protein AAFQ98_18695, partial [Bacteroidota bacterium]
MKIGITQPYFIIILLFSTSSFQLLAQDIGKWNEVHFPFTLASAAPEDWDFLKEDLQRYNYICSGEHHRSELAIQQYKTIIPFIDQNKGLDKLVMERPYAYGFLLNRYLRTGDEKLLRAATDKFWTFDKMHIDSPITHDSFSFFQWLYQYTQRQNSDLEIVGIDLNQGGHGAVEIFTLKYLIDDHEAQTLFP